MSFTIKIIEKREVTTQEKRWLKLGEKEVPLLAHSSDGTKYRIEPIMGWAPPVETTVEREIEVFTQTVEELDLAAVIKAINKL